MNNFTGEWPMRYFDFDIFHNLEYGMTNFNHGTKPPDICIRAAFCFKEQVQRAKNANDMTFLE